VDTIVAAAAGESRWRGWSLTAVLQVGNDDLIRWGVTLDEALAVAVDNLRHSKAPAFVEASPGLFVSQYGDYYDAARITLPEVARQLIPNGDPVAMVPNRTMLLLASSNNSAALEHMIALANEALTEPRRLTAAMFRLTDREWKEWTPAEGTTRTMLDNLQLQMLAADYGDQADTLYKALERAERDIFVATFSLLKKDGDDRVKSYCVLPYQVATWLPRAEYVAVQLANDDKSIVVGWDSFVDVASELLEPIGLKPERFKVRGDLTAEQVQRLVPLEI